MRPSTNQKLAVDKKKHPHFKTQSLPARVTRLALASILGPFRVHLLKFTPDTQPSSLMHYLGLLEFPVRILHHNAHKTYLIDLV